MYQVAVTNVNGHGKNRKMPDPNSILKYLKIKALAESGDPGERDNARRIMSSMEAKDPQLSSAARAVERATNPQHPDNFPPGFSPSTSPNAVFTHPGNWENIFAYAQTAFSGAVKFTQAVVDASLGTQLAEEVETETRVTRAGNVITTFKMSLDTYDELTSLNAIQQATFRAAMHDRLNEQLDVLLGEAASEE